MCGDTSPHSPFRGGLQGSYLFLTRCDFFSSMGVTPPPEFDPHIAPVGGACRSETPKVRVGGILKEMLYLPVQDFLRRV